MLSQARRGEVVFIRDPDALTLGVAIAFPDRRGGVSTGLWSSLNLSGAVGDEPSAVEENKGRVAGAVGVPRGDLRLARQVHGSALIECSSVPLADAEGDILVARTPGFAPGVLTADCVPVLLAGEEGVAAVHAGWRGLVAGAVEKGIESVGRLKAAWVGPSIRSCCYEVGPEVSAAFAEAGLPVAAPDRVDPGEGAVAILVRNEIPKVEVSGICTFCEDRFFSYRRDGVTGRQGAFIRLL